jgi:hypothetical protein
MASDLLLRGLIAGVLAGILAAGFSYVLGEPPLERALAFETSLSAAPSVEPEVVSRGTQRGAGLFAAHVVYGAAFGGFFSLVFAFALGRIGAFGPHTLAALLALAGFVALVLVPELKYPANPPGIGASGTIGMRTTLYFGMLATSLLAMIFAATLATAIAARYGRWDGALISAAAFVLVAAIAGAALPAIDEVPDGFPAGVLWNFRLASIGTRAIFWCALGLSFGAMAEGWLKRRPDAGGTFSP